MAIDQLDRAVVPQGFPAGVGTDALPLDHLKNEGLGLAMGFARTAITVVLALLAILVLLPAAIAAQAANAI